MREERIYQMQEASARRFVLLLRQFEFLQTKIQAYEETLATPWARIKAVFNPDWAKRVVENRQLELLAQRKQEEQRAMATSIKPIVLTGNGV